MLHVAAWILFSCLTLASWIVLTLFIVWAVTAWADRQGHVKPPG